MRAELDRRDESQMIDLEEAEPPLVDAPDRPKAPPVFLAFQGGGARGVAHVGGLRQRFGP
jgi:predicted acylesterase/phospholipase RssA